MVKHRSRRRTTASEETVGCTQDPKRGLHCARLHVCVHVCMGGGRGGHTESTEVSQEASGEREMWQESLLRFLQEGTGKAWD